MDRTLAGVTWWSHTHTTAREGAYVSLVCEEVRSRLAAFEPLPCRRSMRKHLRAVVFQGYLDVTLL